MLDHRCILSNVTTVPIAHVTCENNVLSDYSVFTLEIMVMYDVYLLTDHAKVKLCQLCC